MPTSLVSRLRANEGLKDGCPFPWLFVQRRRQAGFSGPGYIVNLPLDVSKFLLLVVESFSFWINLDFRVFARSNYLSFIRNQRPMLG